MKLLFALLFLNIVVAAQTVPSLDQAMGQKAYDSLSNSINALALLDTSCQDTTDCTLAPSGHCGQVVTSRHNPFLDTMYSLARTQGDIALASNLPIPLCTPFPGKRPFCISKTCIQLPMGPLLN